MGRILEALEAWFTADEWKYDVMPERNTLRTGFSGDAGNWTCYAQAREPQEQFVFYSVAPTKVPEERRHQVAEAITRANYGMIIGNFELDFSDGEIRYKTSVDFENAEIDSAIIRHLVYANVLTMDKYLKAFLGISFGNLSPVDAIQQVESPIDEA